MHDDSPVIPKALNNSLWFIQYRPCCGAILQICRNYTSCRGQTYLIRLTLNLKEYILVSASIDASQIGKSNRKDREIKPEYRN